MSKWVAHANRVCEEMGTENYRRVGVQASNIDQDKIITMSEICNMDSARLIFHACSSFQRKVDKKWSPNADKVTLSNYTGLVGIDKAEPCVNIHRTPRRGICCVCPAGRARPQKVRQPREIKQEGWQI